MIKGREKREGREGDNMPEASWVLSKRSVRKHTLKDKPQRYIRKAKA
jgi:hypothetical protein